MLLGGAMSKSENQREQQQQQTAKGKKEW